MVRATWVPLIWQSPVKHRDRPGPGELLALWPTLWRMPPRRPHGAWPASRRPPTPTRTRTAVLGGQVAGRQQPAWLVPVPAAGGTLLTVICSDHPTGTPCPARYLVDGQPHPMALVDCLDGKAAVQQQVARLRRGAHVHATVTAHVSAWRAAP
jgi:hypothetical protein